MHSPVETLRYQVNPKLEVMNYLNEIIEDFPDAISFASGRPADDEFDLDNWLQQIERYVDYRSGQGKGNASQIKRALGQYGRTNGIICDLITQNLEIDEGIVIDPNLLMVTNGAQEAMAICTNTLFASDRDVLLVVDPTYIGMTGLASINNIEIEGIEFDDEGPSVKSIVATAAEVGNRGKTAKAIYLISDFNNPLGSSISLKRRREIIECCEKLSIIIIEDNPYGLFQFEGEKLPTLMALDQNDNTIYIGSFAKTICPGLRIGYIATRHQLQTSDGLVPLISEMSKVKSLLSVNTGQISQAIVGGTLIQQDFSLLGITRRRSEFYQTNRDAMLHWLGECFDHPRYSNSAITWNQPHGGFFLTVQLPFEVGTEEAFECAQRYSVIIVPISFFSFHDKRTKFVRLSFSYIQTDQIEKGVRAFEHFVRSKI